MVRAALQLALEVARAGAVADPPVEPPRALKPLLKFSRLPERALTQVRRVVDEDHPFRARVVEVAEQPEEVIPRPSLLFLTRPEGWEDELAALAGEAQASAEAARDQREERGARRRVEQAEDLARRAEEAAARARADAAAALAALNDERRLRRAAEREGERALAGVAELKTAVEQAEQRAAEAEADRAALRGRLAGVEAELLRKLADRPGAPGSPPAFDPGPAAGAVERARMAAASLQQALSEAADALAAATGPAGAPSSPVEAAGPVGAPRPAPAEAPRPVGAPRSVPPARRRPLVLPPAVFDDSPEAAAHLVRAPGVVLIVDGYNAAMSIWPGVAVPEVRQRLVDALGELAARTGVSARVVFDGAELPGPSGATNHRSVRVSFSPPDVEADDVILEMADELPPWQALVVASNDRRVQEGARQRGANVISSGQLGTVLGRH